MKKENICNLDHYELSRDPEFLSLRWLCSVAIVKHRHYS